VQKVFVAELTGLGQALIVIPDMGYDQPLEDDQDANDTGHYFEDQSMGSFLGMVARCVGEVRTCR
jgi:hypothetical protein